MAKTEAKNTAEGQDPEMVTDLVATESVTVSNTPYKAGDTLKPVTKEQAEFLRKHKKVKQ